MEAAIQKTLRVIVQSPEGNHILWERQASPPQGTTSAAYLDDGTQVRIVAALREALEQAEFDLSGTPAPVPHKRWPTWWRMSPQMEEAFEAYERVKADFDDFDGDRRGHLYALARREHDLLKSISYSQDPEDDARDSWLIDDIFKSVIENLRAFRAATTEGSADAS